MLASESDGSGGWGQVTCDDRDDRFEAFVESVEVCFEANPDGAPITEGRYVLRKKRCACLMTRWLMW